MDRSLAVSSSTCRAAVRRCRRSSSRSWAKLVLGTLSCHVIRQLEVGFAVEFDATQEVEGLEQLVAGYEPSAAGARAAH